MREARLVQHLTVDLAQLSTGWSDYAYNHLGLSVSLRGAPLSAGRVWSLVKKRPNEKINRWFVINVTPPLCR